MPTSVLRTQKTSGSFGKLYVNDKKEKREKIGTSTLYLISRNLQRSDRGSI